MPKFFPMCFGVAGLGCVFINGLYLEKNDAEIAHIRRQLHDLARDVKTIKHQVVAGAGYRKPPLQTQHIDTNLAHYSWHDMMGAFFGNPPWPNPVTYSTVQHAAQELRRTHPSLASFIEKMRLALLTHLYPNHDEEEEEEDDEEDSEDDSEDDEEDWEDDEEEEPRKKETRREGMTAMWMPQQRNAVQHNKITDRRQKVQLVPATTDANDHDAMVRDQLATTDTYAVPVKQDTLNPTLKNTITRFVNLDSQFRQYTSGPDAQSTSYTCDLSDTLRNVVRLQVYSYQIPFTWYAIDAAYGNTCFWLGYATPSSSSLAYMCVSVPPGNYTYAGMATQLETALTDAGCTGVVAGQTAVFNANNGTYTLYLANLRIIVEDTQTPPTQLVFFDFAGQLVPPPSTSTTSEEAAAGPRCGQTSYFNSTLGWALGFRVPFVAIAASNTGVAAADLNGTKYLMLVVDDYNQNHVNTSLVSITQFHHNVKVPSYFSPDVPVTCLSPDQARMSLPALVAAAGDNGRLVAGKYQHEYTATPVALPSAPRTLTNAQLYSVNAIQAAQNNVTQYLTQAPTSGNILAVLPVKASVGTPMGSLLVEFSGSLQENQRTYFGPVNIERLAVRLLDDKGRVLQLHDADWCVTLLAECLYQY